VRKRPRPTIAFYVYGGSVLLHVALAVFALTLPRPKVNEAIAIELAEVKKKKEPPRPPPPPPPPPPRDPPKPKPAAQQPRAQGKIAPEMKAEPAPLPVGADGFADLGMSLGNADGPGLAVPTPVAAAAAVSPTGPAAVTHKVVQQLAASPTEAACNEPAVRPKRKVPVSAKYTAQARQAEIEGVVRIEVTVDEGGHVVNARVVGGLGYGLDEEALRAARASTFDPAMRCGRPVMGTAILPFRFELT
jgi:protein TonB